MMAITTNSSTSVKPAVRIKTRRTGLAHWRGEEDCPRIKLSAHQENPNVVPLLTFTNTALAGLWLAVAYLRTRSLWLPLGVHWSWNWALGWFFGLPVSGIRLGSEPLLKATDAGPFWVTGGSYGIEGGVACTISLVLFTIFLWRTPWVSTTPELKKLTSEENPARPSTVLSIRPADDHA